MAFCGLFFWAVLAYTAFSISTLRPTRSFPKEQFVLSGVEKRGSLGTPLALVKKHDISVT